MGPIGPALANTVASTYPVASASSSVTYAFNPKTETFGNDKAANAYLKKEYRKPYELPKV